MKGYNRRVIAHLRGRLFAKHPNQAVVECGGVGYDVMISIPTFTNLPAEGSEVSLFVHTHVREDAIALFGFADTQEKLLFERLLSVSGIGPKMAITILSGMKTDELIGAIRGNDIARLTRIPGIGKKTAERMALELKDKLPAAAATAETPTTTPVEEDVISALVNLGYQRALVEQAVSRVAKGGAPGSFDLYFRAALGQLSR